MASVDPPYLRFRMFFFFTKRIICEDPPAMWDLFDEDHIIFLAGLSLSGCYIRIQLRTFFLLIKKLVRGPMDELQADYEDYIRSRSQHPVEFQNVTNDSAAYIGSNANSHAFTSSPSERCRFYNCHTRRLPRSASRS
ncbi:hypothetical protein V3481_013504 [Fusarium oxysporum f. sp. vasinfectum]